MVKNQEKDKYGRLITAQEYIRVKKAPDSRGYQVTIDQQPKNTNGEFLIQFNVHAHLGCARSSDIKPMMQIT